GAVADVRAPRLEVEEVRTRGDLAKRVLPRQPHLDVVRLRRGEAHVAGGERDDAIVEIQRLEDRRRRLRQRLELVPRPLRQDELHQLDFFELMLANEAARVLPRGAGLAAEAR